MIDEKNYRLVTGVPVLDEGTIYYTDHTGESQPFPVTPAFLQRLCDNMNKRDERTGDLSPLVLGKHTDKNAPAKDQPELVGYARRWKVIPWVDGKVAAAADFLYEKDRVEECKGFPRRSAEVWLTRAEIDPISLLGATTPERDLGLVLLERYPDLKVTYTTNLSRTEEIPMEPDKTAMADAATAETGEAKGLEAVMARLDAIEAKLDAVTGGAGAPAAPAGPDASMPGAPAAPGGEGAMSEQELEQLLAELQAQEGAGGATAAPEGPKKDEPVSQNSVGYPGGINTAAPNAEMVKLQRENAVQRDQILRHDYEAKLSRLKETGVEVGPDTLNMIMQLPPVCRDGVVDYISKNNRKAPIGGKNPALDHAIEAPVNGSTSRTEADITKIVQLARATPGKTFEQAARELGHVINPTTK